MKLDDDIDKLMHSVVGGELVEFPPLRTKKAKAKHAAVVELSLDLNAELERNSVPQFVDPTSIPVRFSNLKSIARSPLHYLDAIQSDRDDTLCMRIGRGAHALVLGEPAIQYTARRAGKAWDDFAKRHVDKEILNTKEWSIASGIAESIKRHPEASRLLLGDDVIREKTIEWEWLGRRCTSRPDARSFDCSALTDLKTTQCADPERFARDARHRGYHGQLAFYGLAIKHATGVEPTDLFVAAIESKRPYAVTVLRLDDAARTAGEKMCRLWFERLLNCEQSNAWPAYTDAIVNFTIDGEGDPDSAIEIDDLDPAWA
jgi:hypothetical protein